MNIKELVIAIVVAHVLMELAKFVGAFVFYMVYIALCETSKGYCKEQLDSSNKRMKHFAQKVYKRKWEPLDEQKEEIEKATIGFRIDG